MAYGNAREGKWRGNWRMEWVASTLHTTSEHGVSSIIPLMRTTRLPVVDWTDAPRQFKWTPPFRRKTKSGFCACAITFQLASTRMITNTDLLFFSYSYTNYRYQTSWNLYCNTEDMKLTFNILQMCLWILASRISHLVLTLRILISLRTCFLKLIVTIKCFIVQLIRSIM